MARAPSEYRSPPGSEAGGERETLQGLGQSVALGRLAGDWLGTCRSQVPPRVEAQRGDEEPASRSMHRTPPPFWDSEEHEGRGSGPFQMLPV